MSVTEELKEWVKKMSEPIDDIGSVDSGYYMALNSVLNKIEELQARYPKLCPHITEKPENCALCIDEAREGEG